MRRCTYIYIYTYIYVFGCIYIYIYIWINDSRLPPLSLRPMGMGPGLPPPYSSLGRRLIWIGPRPRHFVDQDLRCEIFDPDVKVGIYAIGSLSKVSTWDCSLRLADKCSFENVCVPSLVCLCQCLLGFDKMSKAGTAENHARFMSNFETVTVEMMIGQI